MIAHACVKITREEHSLEDDLSSPFSIRRYPSRKPPIPKALINRMDGVLQPLSEGGFWLDKNGFVFIF